MLSQECETLSGAFTLQTIRAAEFPSLLPALAQSRRPQPLMHNIEWLQEHCKTNLANLGAFVLLREGNIQGFAPFLQQDRKLRCYMGEINYLSFGLRCLRFMGLPDMPEDKEAWDSLFEAALAQAPDGLYLEAVPLDSYLWNHLRTSPRLSHLIQHPTDNPAEHFVISLPESYEAYMAKFSSKTRNTLQRRVRKLEKDTDGKLRLERITSPDKVGHFVQNAVAISKKTYQWHLLGLGLRDPEKLFSQLSFLAERGWLRCYLLWCGDTPTAFMICHQYRGVCLYIDVGFDPDWTSHSPGTVLHLLVLQDLFVFDRPALFDFGRGAGEHKRQFGNESYRDVDLYLLKPGARTRFACMAQHGSGVVSGAVTRSLDRLGVKRALKKLLRRASVKASPTQEERGD